MTCLRATMTRRTAVVWREGRDLTDADAPSPRSRHDPFAALRERDFLWFVGSRLLSGTGTTLLQAAVAWQVYAISGSALSLGLLGVARFLPALGMSLIGGAVADSYDRRTVLVLAQLAPLGCAAVLLAATLGGWVTLPLIYALVLLIACAAAFENPSRQALLPLVVPRDVFLNAVAVNSTIQQLAFVAGPAAGGVVIAAAGVGSAYAVYLAVVGAGVLLLLALRPRPPEGERRKVSVAAIREGVQFVRQRQVLLGAMALDMFAVIFAGAQAMLPIYAEEILAVGPRGYGLLSSSQAVGAFAMAILLVLLPPIRRTGRALLWSVAAFGLATMLFGISRSFPLSLLAYAATGAADQVSMVTRHTTIQLATPDELRGRVSSVSSIFIGASNQLGMVESGLVAAVTNATFAVVSGGAGCLAVVALIAARMPDLRRYAIAPAPVTAERHVAAPTDVRAMPAGAARARPGEHTQL
jgi:MFS family permease